LEGESGEKKVAKNAFSWTYFASGWSKARGGSELNIPGLGNPRETTEEGIWQEARRRIEKMSLARRTDKPSSWKRDRV